MSTPVGELTIEPDPLPERRAGDYEQMLNMELANVASNASVSTLRLAGDAIVHLYADYDNSPIETTYGLKAELSDSLSTKYKRLGVDERSDLTWEVKHAMARQSILVDSNPDNYKEYYYESRVFMDNQPIFFEPFDYAMLKGFWTGPAQSKLKFEAFDIPSPEQRQILLGGFATFLTILKQ